MAPVSVSMEIPILKDLVIIMAVALITIYLAHRIRIPSIVSFLIAGLIIGPSAFGVIGKVHQIEILAEIGVVFLLFTIGLEFSLKRLMRIKKIVLLGGGVQVLLTTFIVVGISMLFGRQWNQAVLFGFLISLSSTAIVLKLYADRGEIDSLHGNTAVGILLFQDLCIVPMMLIVPTLRLGFGNGHYSFVLIIAKSILAIGGIILAEKLFFPWIMERMVATRIRESFTLTIILFCLGTAFLSSMLGLSLALGAFIAGLIVSESEYSHQAISEIIPITDSLTGLFFISIGMLLDLRFVYNNILKVIGLVVFILLIKGLVLFVSVFIAKHSLRTALLISLGLAQIGEFSFVLAQFGINYGLMDRASYQHFLAASILTMLLTPLFVHVAPGFAFYIQGLLSKWITETSHSEGFACTLEGHVLIVGYGLNGRNLARVLKETGIPYQIVDLNPENVKNGSDEGHPIYFGDATKNHILERLALRCAKVAVVAISDPAATRRIVWQIKKIAPYIYLVARTRYVSEVEELYKIGADQVIPEEFETSVEIFSHVLHRYRVPRNVIDLHVRVIRDSGYKMLRGISIPDERFEMIQGIIATTITETFMVTDDSPAVDKTLAELDLRAKTGVSVMSIIRNNKPITNPSPDVRIAANDVLIMFGNHNQLDEAVEFLSPD